MLRYYICEHCASNITIQQDMHDPIRTKCPKCGKKKLYQDLSGIYVHDGSPRTLGSLAERNSKPSYELQEKRRQYRQDQFDISRKPLIEKGLLSPDTKFDVDYKPPYGELDKNKKKQLFSGSAQEQATKIKNYIEKGI